MWVQSSLRVEEASLKAVKSEHVSRRDDKMYQKWLVKTKSANLDAFVVRRTRKSLHYPLWDISEQFISISLHSRATHGQL